MKQTLPSTQPLLILAGKFTIVEDANYIPLSNFSPISIVISTQIFSLNVTRAFTKNSNVCEHVHAVSRRGRQCILWGSTYEYAVYGRLTWLPWSMSLSCSLNAQLIIVTYQMIKWSRNFLILHLYGNFHPNAGSLRTLWLYLNVVMYLGPSEATSFARYAFRAYLMKSIQTTRFSDLWMTYPVPLHHGYQHPDA